MIFGWFRLIVYMWHCIVYWLYIVFHFEMVDIYDVLYSRYLIYFYIYFILYLVVALLIMRSLLFIIYRVLFYPVGTRVYCFVPMVFTYRWVICLMFKYVQMLAQGNIHMCNSYRLILRIIWQYYLVTLLDSMSTEMGSVNIHDWFMSFDCISIY